MFGVAGTVGFLHRSYTNGRVPFYPPIIVRFGAVGLWINGANALIIFVSNMGEGVVEPVVLTHVKANVLPIIVSGIAVYGGRRVGERLAPNVRALVDAK